MLWLAMIFLIRSYFSHFQSYFDCVKIKVGLFNMYNRSTYLASHNLVSQKCHKIFGYISTISSQILMVWNAKLFFDLLNWKDLINPIYQTQHTKLNLLKQIISLGTKPNQIYWSKYNKPYLPNFTYNDKSSKQNVQTVKNQIYLTKYTKPNLFNHTCKLNPPNQF